MLNDTIVGMNDPILITGANGFIGSKVVEILLSYGFNNVRCLVRSSNNVGALNVIISRYASAKVDLVEGNLLSRDDCDRACKGVAVIYNLVAGMEKSFPGCFMNSVVTLRNLLESARQHSNLKRFLHVSSFAVYSNFELKRGGLLDETCEIETHFMERSDAYCYGKVKQDEFLREYGDKYNVPYVIVRPGVPYGAGVKAPIHARVGIDPFGIFFHLGRSNILPFTYIDNCADAIVMAGIKKGIDREVFNIVDDNLPTSKKFLRLYKKHVGHFRSLAVPYWFFYIFCSLWEKYSHWSGEQLPPAFNRRKCAALWKGNRYSNNKLKDLVGWKPKLSFDDVEDRYFEYLMKLKGKVN